MRGVSFSSLVVVVRERVECLREDVCTRVY